MRILVSSALGVLAVASVLAASPDQPVPARSIDLPLYFEAHGSSYVVRGAGYGLVLEEAEARLSFRGEGITIAPRNSNPAPESVAEKPLSGRSHYYLGNDSSAWVTDVPQFGRVRFRNVYDGVDLLYYGVEGKVEFDFVVGPGVDPDVLELSFEGASSIAIDEDGDLILDTSAGVLRQHKPVAYQDGTRGRIPVMAAFRLTDDGTARFELGEYDRTRPLIIDPILNYSSYVGGNNVDWVNSVAYGPDGNLFVCGGSGSTVYPPDSQLSPSQQPGDDAFMMKLTPDGTTVLYSTYIGGSGDDLDFIYCDVQQDGSAVMAGLTIATDFPLLNPLQNSYGGGDTDVFVVRFDPNGQVAFSTYLGGADYEGPGLVALDKDDNILVAGWTASTNFPLMNPFQNQFGGVEDGFLTKLSPTGSQILASTYLGGTGFDYFYGIAAGPDGSMYGSGYTDSTDFPVTQNALQQTRNGIGDAFAAKFSPSGSDLTYATYLGGSDDDWSVSNAVDADGNMYLAGSTYSSDFPVLSIQATYGGDGDVFITKLNSTGTGIVHSTYLGGSASEGPEAIAINSYGEVFVTGWTESADFPLEDPTQSGRRGGDDGFLAKVNAAGDALVYSTYLGGPSDDLPLGLDVDQAGGTVAVGGWTEGSGFPTAFPAQASFGGDQDGILAIYIEAAGTSAASYAPNQLTPDSIAAVFGGNFSVLTLISSAQPPPTSLLNTTVTITDSEGTEHQCGMFFIAGGPLSQINIHVPPQTALGPATLTVTTADGRKLRGGVDIVAVAPGLFSQSASGRGVAAANVVRYRNGEPTYALAARFENGQWVHEPIDMGPETDQIYLFLYGTGMRAASSATITIGGEAVGVAGPVAQGQFIGLDQMNLGPLPRSLVGRGEVEIEGEIDGQTFNVLTVEIQ